MRPKFGPVNQSADFTNRGASKFRRNQHSVRKQLITSLEDSRSARPTVNRSIDVESLRAKAVSINGETPRGRVARD